MLKRLLMLIIVCFLLSLNTAMAWDNAEPADDVFVSTGPYWIRTKCQALKEDQIVDAGWLKGYVPGNSSGNIPLSNGTVNTNLNADLLDGYHASSFAGSTGTSSLIFQFGTGGVKGKSNSGVFEIRNAADDAYANIRANQLISNISTGTSPLLVSSTTLVNNLNADLLDGYHASSFARLDQDVTFTKVTVDGKLILDYNGNDLAILSSYSDDHLLLRALTGKKVYVQDSDTSITKFTPLVKAYGMLYNNNNTTTTTLTNQNTWYRLPITTAGLYRGTTLSTEYSDITVPSRADGGANYLVQLTATLYFGGAGTYEVMFKGNNGSTDVNQSITKIEVTSYNSANTQRQQVAISAIVNFDNYSPNYDIAVYVRCTSTSGRTVTANYAQFVVTEQN